MDQTRRGAIIGGISALLVLGTSHALRGMPCRIWGAGDPPQDAESAAIVAKITDVRLCMDCITARTHVTRARVAAILERAQMTLRLAEEGAACARCSRDTTVYGLGLRKQTLSA